MRLNPDESPLTEPPICGSAPVVGQGSLVITTQLISARSAHTQKKIRLDFVVPPKFDIPKSTPETS